ncbi:MAG: M28 family peptidase [Prevotella sp.]|nr:M28 family peptidase [Prevotella sp.]
MANLKTLAKDTAIYGLSSIVARFINYLLVPIQTARFAASGGEYGVITHVYAYVSILIILLTFGMETTFFRFMNRDGETPERIYATTLRMLACTSFASILLVLALLHPIAAAVGYADHPEYVAVMYITVAVDAFTAIPFAYLRYQHKPVKFATLKIANILLNIALNLLYLIVLPALRLNPFGIYDEQFTLDVAFVFYINLACTLCTLLMLWKELSGFRFGFDAAACRRMLGYTWPLLIMGVTGQLNQAASQILFPYLYAGSVEEARAQLGIYGACIKIAMIMVMITQAFRFAYEPFVFGKSKDKDNRETYAQAMKFYLIFTLLAFLCVTGYIDLLKFIIGESYWEGLKVVPIVMAAEIMFGVFFNLSFWYKLTDRTIWGAYFSGIGALVLISIDVLFIPRFSYVACAWAGFAAYAVSMLLSYFIGQRYYPIRYPLGAIGFYVLLAFVAWFSMDYLHGRLPLWASLTYNTLAIGFFVAIILRRDFPLRSLPVVGKYFKVIALAIVVAGTTLACSNTKSQSGSTSNAALKPTGPAFSADSAFAFCQQQCDFGPRTMNSEAHEKCGQWIAAKFEGYGLQVTEQRATLKGFDGTPLQSNNIIASYQPEKQERILICAHWDSRPWADNDPDEANWDKPVMAANDGASGVAVMLELARLLNVKRSGLSDIGIDFVCFDAEDWGSEDVSDSWALGAQYWAAHPHVKDYTARYGILLDMVGGQGARFFQEGYSLYYAPQVVERVWKAAETVGYGSFFPTKRGGTITDDHGPVNEVASIPCIDIIPYYPDCEASSFGPTWHTVADDMEHIDRNTLQAVGQTLVQVLFTEPI